MQHSRTTKEKKAGFYKGGNKIEVWGSRAFGTSSFCLPIVVARAGLLVSISSRRHTQALCTTLLTEEHAWLLVSCL